MRIHIAITTARRPTPTLDAALASLLDAGCPLEPEICRDVTAPRRGIVRTWQIALVAALVDRPDVALVMQDDVTWPADSWADALEALEDLLAWDPAVGYASLHTMPRVRVALGAARSAGALVPMAAAEPGGRARYRACWYRTDTLGPYLYKHRWCGAQCWALPRPAAERLLDDRGFQSATRTLTRGLDHIVTDRFAQLGLHTYTWYPSLLSHALGQKNRAYRKWRTR